LHLTAVYRSECVHRRLQTVYASRVGAIDVLPAGESTHASSVEDNRKKEETYSSVGPRPSSYWIGRDKERNLSADFCDSRPNRISFSMSTNSVGGI
jgi:hypothetical protein